MGPILKLVQVPLDGMPSFYSINCMTQLGAICNLMFCFARIGLLMNGSNQIVPDLPMLTDHLHLLILFSFYIFPFYLYCENTNYLFRRESKSPEA